MALDINTTKRLVLIKYMFDKALEQSYKPYPASQLSLLTFHDAIELFLYLAYEKAGGTKSPDKITFMGYWDLINGKLEKEITRKVSMDKLNKARGLLKHRGNLPSDSDIEEFRINSKNFFEENTKIVFGAEFSELSLIDLIDHKEVKNNLKEAEMLKDSNLEEAFYKAAIAFNQLINDYKIKRVWNRGFYGSSLTESISFFRDFNSKADQNNIKFNDLSNFAHQMEKSIEYVDTALTIISLGINYRKYDKFTFLTPKINKRLERRFPVKIGEDNLNKEDVQFCIDFVIESAIAIQEFDFDIK